MRPKTSGLEDPALLLGFALLVLLFGTSLSSANWVQGVGVKEVRMWTDGL